MFEDLQLLRPVFASMFTKLTPLPTEAVERGRMEFPECPESYWKFVSEIGVGSLEQEGEPFFFERQLLSAERDYYHDHLIYANGAKGDVRIFGNESMGTAYGFDTGAKWGLVEVDELRIVTHLDLSFEEFIRGLIVCYPQIPMKFFEGKWFDGMGAEYSE